jgi:uncharacterized protein YaiE (UPF0345 family)
MNAHQKYLEPATKAVLKLALSLSTIGVVASFAAALPNAVEAASFKFSGHVTDYEFNNEIAQDGSVALNTVVSGLYSFDCPSALCQQQASSTNTYYDASPNSGATVDIGNYTFETEPYESFGSAGSELNMIVENATSWITIGIGEKNALDMNRVSPAGGSYSAIWMRPLLGSLGKLAVSSSQGMYQDEPDVWIEAEITSIEKVPEPASILGLLTAGALGATSLKRKGKENN